MPRTTAWRKPSSRISAAKLRTGPRPAAMASGRDSQPRLLRMIFWWAASFFQRLASFFQRRSTKRAFLRSLNPASDSPAAASTASFLAATTARMAP